MRKEGADENKREAIQIFSSLSFEWSMQKFIVRLFSFNQITIEKNIDINLVQSKETHTVKVQWISLV